MTKCDPRRIGLSAALSGAAVLSLFSPYASAQAEDQASARALFDEGRAFMKDGRYADACPKLEAARRLYTSAGILLNLADCHEKVGRTASAWTEFGEAQTVARRTGRDADAEEARRRQTQLEPALARVVVRVAHAAPGMTVARDGTTLAPAAWGTALPVDPGEHSIRAEAPGFAPWAIRVSASEPAQVATVDVPELHPLPVATETANPVTPAKDTGEAGGSSSRFGRTLPWVLVGGGAAIGLGGGVVMLIESGRASDARNSHDQAAYDATKTPWTIGLVGAIVGAASAAVGGTLLALPRGDANAATPALSFWIDEGHRGGALIAGSW
jgi:hypothetical protein